MCKGSSKRKKGLHPQQTRFFHIQHYAPFPTWYLHQNPSARSLLLDKCLPSEHDSDKPYLQGLARHIEHEKNILTMKGGNNFNLIGSFVGQKCKILSGIGAKLSVHKKGFRIVVQKTNLHFSLYKK